MLGAALLSACATGPTNPSAQLRQTIASARTPADHEALAKYYVAEAAASRLHAEKYRKLKASPQQNPTGGRGNSNPKARYNSIIDMYEGEALEYDKLAEQQHAMGQAMQSP